MTTKCTKCGHAVEVGQWPFCPHGETNNRYAQRFDPIVVHKSIETGAYSVPGHSSDPVPSGYQAVEIRTLRDADRLTREMSQAETLKRRETIDGERDYWDRRIAEKRKVTDERLKRVLGKNGSRVLDLYRQYRDDQRKKKYASLSHDVMVAPNVFVYDRSNRRPEK